MLSTVVGLDSNVVAFVYIKSALNKLSKSKCFKYIVGHKVSLLFFLFIETTASML